MIRWILKKLVGVELKKENLNLELKRIVSCVIVIVVSGIILFAIFPVIDNLIQSSGQAWYAGILAKYSFLAISIKIIFLSLFTNLNNPVGCFKAVFFLQLLGFIGGVIIHTLLNGMINPSPNIDSGIKFTYGLLPFFVNAVIFFATSKIYKQRHFDEDKFFRHTT
jgi:hypothetical protein